MNSVRLNNRSLKYQRCTLSDYKDIAIRIFKFVTKIPFLLQGILINKNKNCTFCTDLFLMIKSTFKGKPLKVERGKEAEP